MNNISPKIIFFGTEDFSATALQGLIESRFHIVAVVTKPDSKRGRGQKLTEPEVKKIAQSHNIPVWQPDRLSDIVEQITALQPLTGVLVSFGKIIPQAILDLFTPGIINVHPSLLPQYRGPSPIESAILNGDAMTGVTIMQLGAKMDAGPVYTQVHLALTGSETQPELYATLATIGTHLLINSLPDILSGSLLPQPQDETLATYCHIIKKTDGVIDWTKPARLIEREIRAYKDWPQSRATLGTIEVIISSALAEEPSNYRYKPGKLNVVDEKGILFVEAADANLRINSIKPLGKKEMPVSAFLKGYRSQLGI